MPTMANIKLCLSQTFNANILSTNYTKVYNWKVYRKLVWFRSKSFQLWLLMLFFDRIFCLKSDSHLPNKFVLFALLKPFKTIYLFVMSFWSCRKNGLIRKISLTAKFMTHNLANKQLQYSYWPISYEIKATRQWKLVS